mmetsp:Transcript_39650/g.80916  ORF Transcript_39650/g.80916 Transcript_39650/m.80916 type:complete len:121 (-) Transcript_39650:215-577(-)
MTRNPLDSAQKDRNKEQPILKNPGCHRKTRILMMQHIAEELIQTPQHVKKLSNPKLIQLARKLEGMLYYTSPSLEAYSDLTTLTDRMKAIAKKFAAPQVMRSGEGNESSRLISQTDQREN